ncbi:glycerate kinase [Shewanella aestuarii]|uniref:Glycerate kinase n=1 Tax=Shewanella aestuarii TaxID=1028752 RepID=A0A6G9QI17_9GAMM|nr:glycerate kinase [Shewanella aestuarii]QIR14112.1 glycerate kinase [Shewanella aestuarii]
MKIVIAPDSFKESLTALQVAQAIEQGFKQVFPDAQYDKVPMADGGEGTVQAMVDATEGEIISVEVSDPLGSKVNAFYGILGSVANKPATAVIEMAAASGLHLVPRDQRNPLVTSSFGTGELIKHALDRGIKHIILGLGGSATNDAGTGMAQALGIKLLTASGESIKAGGAGLSELATIDTSHAHPAIKDCHFEVACDVDNPLCGPRGASAIFGPQKGATADMVEQLDIALSHFSHIVTQELKQDVSKSAGAGAAGGMGFGVMTFLQGQLRPGIELVIKTVGLEKYCQQADLVITGEGRIDGQTVFGKTPMGVLQVAQHYNVPTIGIAGSLGDNADAIVEQGMTAIFPIIPGVASLDEVLAHATTNLINTSVNVARLIKLKL